MEVDAPGWKAQLEVGIMFSASSIKRLAAAQAPALALMCGFFFLPVTPADAQRDPPKPCDNPRGCPDRPPPRVLRDQIQPPVFRAPPAQPPVTVIPFLAPTTNNTPLIPTDVTAVNITNPEVTDPLLLSDMALIGVNRTSSFPAQDDLGSADGIIVKATEGTQFSKNNSVVTLTSGSVLVSVRAPSEYALVTTPLGDVAIGKGGDAMVKFASPLRVFNLDGRGDRVKVKVTSIHELQNKLVSVAPGYELVVGPEKLGRPELRPADGFARRYSKVLENGHMAVSEFSVESFMSTSQLIAQMAQKDAGSKEKRILGDMSKMAAVLIQLNGVQGFVASGEQR